jgi:hypothetical protein
LNRDLSSLFAQQQTNQINWDGPVYSLYELPRDTTELTIRFQSAASKPRQGLRLKVRGGTLEIESRTSGDVILWQDTAPAEIHVRVRWKPRGLRSLRIWNAWQVNDVTQAWLGNAGMRVTPSAGGVYTLRCSDGEGEPDFDDLVAEVHVR